MPFDSKTAPSPSEDVLTDAEVEALMEHAVWEDDLLSIEERNDERDDVHPFFVLDPQE
jgi:hypothetical protein